MESAPSIAGVSKVVSSSPLLIGRIASPYLSALAVSLLSKDVLPNHLQKRSRLEAIDMVVMEWLQKASIMVLG